MKDKKSTVCIALSGGIDSCFSAHLLKQQGYTLKAVTLAAPFFPDTVVTRSKEFCEQLDIEHHVLDISADFQKQVIDYLISSYCLGLTPNPCALCNRKVKFSLLLDYALGLGCEFLATGHYARIYRDKGGPFLGPAGDKNKSQEYFLALIKKQVLDKVIFPLSELTKKEVTDHMEKNYPCLKESPESQEICFIKNKKYREFIEKRIPDPYRYCGPIRHVSGKILGRHKGIFRYTYGQREGLGISWKEPLYVLDIDCSDMAVIVGERKILFKDHFSVSRLNWFYQPGEYKDLKVRIRYNSALLDCTCSLNDADSLDCRLTRDKDLPAPGQIAVFYDGNRIVCAGTIQKQGIADSV